MRKVYLDDLPIIGKSDRINWNESVGHKVKFIYDDIEGEIEILAYDGKYLTIKYLDRKPFCIYAGNFKKCALGGLVGVYTNEFKCDIGQVFKDDKRDMIITDREYRGDENNNQNKKWYKYTCNKCGWTEGWAVEGDLKRGRGCSCCYGRTAVLGINTIWDTDRWMCDLGVSEEDAKKHTRGSNKKIRTVCRDCGSKKTMTPNYIYKYKSINCICSDGTSYPEKFMMGVLKQLNIEFETQYSPKWIKPKRYDFYIHASNLIIETHGIQHFEESPRGRSLKEELENDRVKKELALANGIEHYIVIDCRYSDMEYIKSNILNSELNEIFDLSQIDWGECEKFALKSFSLEIWNYWNNRESWETTQTIVHNNEWGIKSITTIRKILRIGVKYNKCNYKAKEELFKNLRTSISQRKRKVVILKDKTILGVFESVSELEKQSEELFEVKLSHSHISQVCNGKQKSHKGFTFKYIEDNISLSA